MELNVILLLNSYKTFNANKWADAKNECFQIVRFDFWVQKTWQTGLIPSYSHL